MSHDNHGPDHDDAHDDDHDHEHEHGHEHEHDHDEDIDIDEALEEALEIDTQSEIFLEMRRQNLDLLRIATEVSGYAGEHGPLKPGDLRTALRSIWEVFSEFYTWVDPEETDDDDEEDDEEDED